MRSKSRLTFSLSSLGSLELILTHNEVEREKLHIQISFDKKIKI